jgi:iron-sulfur cluster assembly protein
MTAPQTIVADCPVRLTESAFTEIRRLMKENGLAEGEGLRVGVKGGGCSGMSYLLDFGAAAAQDQVFEQDGVTIIVDPSHAIYLVGMEIDWENGLANRGFTFNNPNAAETCGCGTSFSA